jgi:sulfatase maturation enzyme AslB (radical SAM superfamily)
MEAVIPLLTERGIHVQLVTSAFRPLPTAWAKQERLNVVVSIDGLQPEHDQRRAPATYERILRNIEGGRITIHCTITGQMRKRKDYLAEFLQFWHPRPEIKRLWFSIFTPQIGDQLPEILTPEERIATVEELLVLREKYPKVEMPEGMIRAYLKPPASPEECTFAQTTHTLSADFHTAITPCQFGGEPDCSSCGCIASAGLHAIGEHKLARVLPVKVLFRSSLAIGRLFRGRRRPVNRPSDLVDTILPAPAPPSARYRSKAEG